LYNSFDTVLALDGRRDRQTNRRTGTEIVYQYCAWVCWRAIKVIYLELDAFAEIAQGTIGQVSVW